MRDQQPQDRYLVPGLMRGVEILRLFTAQKRTLSPPEIARSLSIPRSTVFRLAQTLEHLGLLERVDGNAYRLGIGVLSLGFEYLASMDLSEVAGPRLRALRDATGLATHIVTRDEHDVVVLQKVRGHGSFAGGLTVGSRLPAHATALGRMTLLDMDRTELRALYKGTRLKKYTQQTPTSLSELETMLDEDRQRGYAISLSFFESGISAVAAPIRNAQGHIVAAINATAQGMDEISQTLIDQVVGAADEISQALGDCSSED